MNILRFECRNFRNYESLTYSFQPNCIHVLTGKNAQGKTNLIEAFYFLSHLRSFRTNYNQAMIRYNQDFFSLKVVYDQGNSKKELKAIVLEKEKHLYQFSNPVHRYSDFIGQINCILFCPDDLMIFQQSPKVRRRFIDLEMIKLSKMYTAHLNRFQKLLKERNAILKKDRIDSVLLETITQQMIQDQEIILQQRLAFLEDLMQKTQRFYAYFSEGEEIVGAKYKTFVDINDNFSLQEVYEKSLNKDMQYRQTQYGIHKDDIEFHMNGIPIKDIASQGQKRSFVLSLKLALCKIIQEKTKEYPILLLDDVFSELDNRRSQKLISILPESMQVFVTTTEKMKADWFKDKKVNFYQIEHGRLKEVIK